MRKIILCASALFLVTFNIIAQDSMTAQISPVTIVSDQAETTINKVDIPAGSSPYKTSFKVDAPIIAAGVGLTALGVKLIDQKKDLTPAQYAQKIPENVWFFDRGNAGVFSKRADDLSYIPFKASFVLPVVVGLIDKNQRQHYGQVLVLYAETMAITGAMFTMAAGTVQRSRPFVYGRNNGVDDEYRMSGNNQRSFFAGHTAATAAATFFTAKVFADYNPNSKARPYVWAAAAAVPALVGYWRYQAGMHFLSDNIIGFGVGAAVGILVPQFHKNWKVKNMTVAPQFGGDYQGLAITYKM